MRADTVIIGLGNLLMTDEGVGVRVVQALLASGQVPAGVEVLDLGTGGMSLLHAISGRRKVVAVDCARMGEEPGTIRRFTPEEADSRKFLSRLSLHEGDLFSTLELARALGDYPQEVVIFGIEPRSLAPGEKLTPELEARIADYVAEIVGELGRKPTRGGV